MAISRRLASAQQYTIGWIAALPIERAAAKAMLDEVHNPPDGFVKHSSDTNQYTWGAIGQHNIVIASLPAGRYGTVSAAGTAHAMQASLPDVRFGLLVGIGAGIPRIEDGIDVRLGDVVVSTPRGRSPGVVQYDLGKAQRDDVFKIVGSLNSPPEALLKAVGTLEADHMLQDTQIPAFLQEMLVKYPKMSTANEVIPAGFVHQGSENDRLFHVEAFHVNDPDDSGSPGSTDRSCLLCDPAKELHRRPRRTTAPTIHHGTIASGDTVIKDGISRQVILERLGDDCLCFEMEAAGLMNSFPCLVVRGICDYADSHKNDRWQPYAAATAAAYAKELLTVVDAYEVQHSRTIKTIFEEFAEVKESLLAIERHATQTETVGILSRLPFIRAATFDYEDDEKDVLCLPDTRTQILDAIHDWAKSDEDKPIFWLSGIAGTGKTTIARTVADRWHKQKRLGASFFFKRGERQRSSASMSLSTIARQLASRVPGIRYSLTKVLAEDPNITNKALAEQFRTFILNPLKAMDSTLGDYHILVIDALDECANEKDTRTLIQLLASTSRQTKLRCFVTCRPESVILEQFSNVDQRTYRKIDLHEVTAPSTEKDIEIFLWTEFDIQKRKAGNRSMPLIGDPSWPSADSIRRLAQRANPLFVFATTVCRYIWDARSNPQERLDEILTKPKSDYPSQMEQTYMPIIDRIILDRGPAEEQTKLSFRALVGTILILFEPLSTSCLRAFNLEEACSLLSSLHSVLEIPNADTDPVRILHISFRDFIVSDGIQHDPKHWFRIPERLAHQDIFYRCLAFLSAPGRLFRNILYLLKFDTTRSDVSNEVLNARITPELSYACRYWVDHLVAWIVDSQIAAEALHMVDEFLRLHILHWLEVMMWLGEPERCIEHVDNLHMLARRSPNCQSIKLLDDASSLLKTYYLAVISTPLHLYISALLFSPLTSVLRQNHSPEMPQYLKLKPSANSQSTVPYRQLEGHSAVIINVMFSKHGRYMASTSIDGIIRLWDSKRGVILRSFSCDPQPMGNSRSRNRTLRRASGLAADFSQDECLFAASPVDSAIEVVHAENGVALHSLQARDYTTAQLLFTRTKSPGLLSVTNTGSLMFWDLATGDQVDCLDTGQGLLQTIEMSHDGQLLVTMCSLGTIRLWDVTSRQQICRVIGLHDAIVRLLARSLDAVIGRIGTVPSELRSFCVFSPSTPMIAICQNGSQLQMWNLKTYQHLWNRGKNLNSAVFSPRGALMAVRSCDKISILDATHGHILHTLDVSVTHCVFDPTSDMLLLLSQDNIMETWHFQSNVEPRLTGQYKWSMKSARRRYNCQLVASPDNRHVILTSPENEIIERTIGEDHVASCRISAIAFSADGKALFSAMQNSNSVSMWDTATGNFVRQYPGPSPATGKRSISTLAVSTDGAWLAAVAPGVRRPTLLLWVVESGQLTLWFDLYFHRHQMFNDIPLAYMAFSPDSAHLILADGRRGIFLWNTKTKKEHSIRAVFCDTKKRENINSFYSVMRNPVCIAHAPNHQIFAAVTAGFHITVPRLVEIFATDTRKLVRCLNWPEWTTTDDLYASNVLYKSTKLYMITQMCFSADSTILAALWEDRQISIWNTTTGVYLKTFQCWKQPDVLNFSTTAPCVLETEYETWHMSCLCTIGDHDWESDRLERWFIVDDWLIYRGERQLWLPPEYRGLVARSSTGSLAIGQTNGKFSIYG